MGGWRACGTSRPVRGRFPFRCSSARDELLELPGAGASIPEISHRSPAFEAVIEEAEANLRGLLAVPENHRVLFLHGGASPQFSMAPMNLLRSRAAYVLTGTWGRKAVAEARRHGEVDVVWDGAEDGYSTVPERLEPSPLDYLHVTSNETIEGVELQAGFEPAGGAPLVCDASSDFLSRPIPVERYGLLYAGAQKNAGPAGLAVALIREDVLEGVREGLPKMLYYRTHATNRSLYNTPPVFAVYVFMLVTRWLRDDVGGLERMHGTNREKAALLYEAIDGSEAFYRGRAAAEARSLMNVTFRLPGEDIERAFVSEATANGLAELKGHRSISGIRASIYNAMPLAGARELGAFMDAFRARHA